MKLEDMGHKVPRQGFTPGSQASAVHPGNLLACAESGRYASGQLLKVFHMCRRMQALVAKEKEPITPFLAKIGALRQKDVSCILVMGGSGDYFGVSDTVLCMDSYACQDVTKEALAIDQRFGSSVASHNINAEYGTITPRCPVSIYPGSPQGPQALSFHPTLTFLKCI